MEEVVDGWSSGDGSEIQRKEAKDGRSSVGQGAVRAGRGRREAAAVAQQGRPLAREAQRRKEAEVMTGRARAGRPSLFRPRLPATGQTCPGPELGVSGSRLVDDSSATDSLSLTPEETPQAVDLDNADDAADTEQLAELAELRASGKDPAREREIIAGLIGAWEPIFKGWLVVRYGRDDGCEIAENVVVRLVDLLVRGRKMTASWRACVWRIVADERYRYEQQRKHSRGLIDPEGDPGAAADPAAEAEFDRIFDPGRDETRLMHLVEKLPDRDRQVIQLRVIKERPRAEAAEILGLTVNGLDQALHRAVAHLSCLARENGVSGTGDRDEEGA